MKRKFSRIFGLTLALVLALSLVFPAAAVAGTNKWSAETIMSYSSTLAPTKTISPNEVVALAGDSEGDALYAIVAGGIELLTDGDGIAEWSTDQANSGSYSVKLTMPATGAIDEDCAGVKVYYGEALSTITDPADFTFYAYTALAHTPYAIFYLDTTGDGAVDRLLISAASYIDQTTFILPTDQWVEVEWFAGEPGWKIQLYDPVTDTRSPRTLPWNDLEHWKTEYPTATIVYAAAEITWRSDTTLNPFYIDDITIGDDTYGLPSGTVYKSTNGGESWGTAATTAPTRAVAVAVAPDDPDYVIAADAAGNVYVTVNGGTSWSSTDLTTSFTAVTCVDISVPDSLGKRWIAVGGNLSTAGALMVSKIETFTTPVNATSAWTDFATSTKVLAVKYSPMLDYDETLLAVTIDGTDTHLQVGSIANDRWNNSTDFGADWPADIITGTSAVAASIALPDVYDGVEPTARVAYIGTNVGAYRMDNTTDKELITTDYRSVAYNSVDNMLLIGSGSSAAVKMSANPDTSAPSFTTAYRYKYPSGTNVAALAWVGSTMVCGTMGAESAVSISTDARSWNQVSLIDSDLDDMTDVAVSEDGATIYLASVQGNVTSIWRYASSWERVFCVDIDSAVTAGDVIVRLVPGDPEHILIAEVGGDEIRVSKDSGDTWKRAKSKVTIVDIAVKDATTVHVLGTTKVSTSTDGGRHFGTGKKTLLTTNTHIVVASNGDVLVAGVYAGVVTAAYSDDDAATFSRTAESTGIIPETSGTDGIAILIAPDKDYATNSAIFVAFDEDDADNDGSGDNYIMRWEIGAGAEEWKSRGPAGTDPPGIVLDPDYWFTGLGYYGGALYATAMKTGSSTHVFSVDPGTALPLAPTWGTPTTAVAAEFGCAPQALRFSTGSNKLWAVDVTTDITASKLWSFADTVSLDMVAPTLLAPAAAYEGGVDVVLNRINPIRFSWESVHTKVGYELNIGTDEAVSLNKESYDAGTDEYITISDGTTDNAYPFIAGETYYWRVRVNDPVMGPWSEVRSFSVAEAVAAPVEVTVEAPAVTVEAPAVTVEAPTITVPAPVITVEAPAAADITVEMPPAEAPETPGYIWSIIAIGAVLVIAVIILIVRTRRVA